MKRVSLLLLLHFLFTNSWSQAKADTLRIMSYNVENYFDCQHDSLKNDYEFLPDGKKHWTVKKYKQKQANIAKVIAAVGEWKTPAIIGLYEVENEKGLIALTRYSPLKQKKYKFIHKESPDRRGIDVALLYQKNKFKPVHTEFIAINNPKHPKSKTRDILYAAGTLRNGDTLHVFLCHFPSRLGGEKASEPKRVFVASTLRSKTDSLFALNSKANIVIIGDFNDYPTNKSIYKTLNASELSNTFSPKHLYNLFYHYQIEQKGSNKYRGKWGVLDQIIVSTNLVDKKSSTYSPPESAKIFDATFLLTEDKRYMGKQPFRTYNGFKYLGGYSDHLPVYTDIIVK